MPTRLDRLRVVELTPRHVAQFIAWMCDPQQQDGRELADSTIRNALNPVRACLATAVHEGVIRHNPTTGAALPHRPRGDDQDEHEARPLTTEQLAMFLDVAHSAHRPLFALLAGTGLRISEALALQWKHVRLDGSRPVVRVRRAYVRGRYGPPKPKYGRRDVPLASGLVRELRVLRHSTEWPGDDDLVFPSQVGTPLLVENVRRRYLQPAAQEPAAGGRGSTRSATRARRGCSRPGATPCRCSAGSGITRPRSHSSATCTYSTTTSATRSSCLRAPACPRTRRLAQISVT